MSEQTTTRFQSAIVHTLRPVAPGLAALHAVRLRNRLCSESGFQLPPALSPLTCPACGYPSLSSRTRTRHKGMKRLHLSTEKNQTDNGRTSRVRLIERTCSVCTFTETTSLPSSNSQPRVSHNGKAHQGGTVLPDEPCDTVKLTPSGITPSASTRPCVPPAAAAAAAAASSLKRSHKKKAGLQEMLARNRDRQQLEKQREQEEVMRKGSLSSFLDAL